MGAGLKKLKKAVLQKRSDFQAIQLLVIGRYILVAANKNLGSPKAEMAAAVDAVNLYIRTRVSVTNEEEDEDADDAMAAECFDDPKIRVVRQQHCTIQSCPRCEPRLPRRSLPFDS